MLGLRLLLESLPEATVGMRNVVVDSLARPSQVESLSKITNEALGTTNLRRLDVARRAER